MLVMKSISGFEASTFDALRQCIWRNQAIALRTLNERYGDVSPIEDSFRFARDVIRPKIELVRTILLMAYCPQLSIGDFRC